MSMNLKDWSTLLLMIQGPLAWLYSIWREAKLRKEMEKKEAALQAELRGVRGFKFRAMWRAFATQHGLPINGEDSD